MEGTFMGNRVYHLDVGDLKPGAAPQRRKQRVGFPPPWLIGLDDTASLPSSTPIVDPVSQGPSNKPDSDHEQGLTRSATTGTRPRTCRSRPLRIDAAPMACRRLAHLHILLAPLVVIAILLGPRDGYAGDYDRNDVLSRELGFGAMMLPVDGSPVALMVRGSARSHVRRFYFGTEVSAGFVLDVRPLLTVGTMIGLESADDAWQPLRAYAEVGAGLFWANTGPLELLNFHAEAGVRYIVTSFRRPHLSLHMGARALTSLARFGGTITCGVQWTFD